MSEPNDRPSPDLAGDLSTDLEGRLRGYAVPDGVRPPQLVGDVGYVAHETPVGRLLLAARSDGRLLASSYAPDDSSQDEVLARLARRVSPRVVRDPRALDAVRTALDSYFGGGEHAFDEVEVDLALATPFQREVLPALRSGTAYGERTSYGVLAGVVGHPRAARAVGAALGANPLCIVVPCHRVVAGNGALTGYAGGLAAKEYLLDLEATPHPA
jgi:methylated-DNA-[protein]-cysteine S-methyltransferase